VELFRNTNIDFLGKKWYFLAFSLIFSVAGVFSMLFWHHIPLGVDFNGGTIVYVRFSSAPNPDQIRARMDQAGLRDTRIQTYGPAANNEVLISLPLAETSEAALDKGKLAIIQALAGNAPAGKADLNNTSGSSLAGYLLEKDPLHLGTDAPQRYTQIAQAIADQRDKNRGGVLSSFDDLKGAAPAAVLQQVQSDFYLSDFGVRNVEIVGPQVGKQLQRQALLATLYSLGGMLIYLAFRFELIYGVAAVVACFHDTLITVGAFSLTNKEISLTVIAAILTLVGYSMNDTIVVFDRIRENLKLLRPDGPLPVRVRGRSAAWILFCAGHRHPDRYILFDRSCGPHAGGVPELAGAAIGTGPHAGRRRTPRGGQHGLRPDAGSVVRKGRGQPRKDSGAGIARARNGAGKSGLWIREPSQRVPVSK
jgi:preprotein translocase subunit SecF